MLAQRVLSKVLDNMGVSYDVMDESQSIESTLASDAYDIVFTDADMLTAGISNTNENIAIISSNDSNGVQDTTVQKGESISATASREEIEHIISKYRG